MTRPGRIRVLQFITNFKIGGTERQFVMLNKHLDPERFEVHVACMQRTGSFTKEMEKCGMPITDYGITSLHDLGSLKLQLKFASYLRKNRIQIVHTHGFYPNIFGLPPAKLARTPVVIASIRDIGDLWTSRQRWVQKQICRLGDRVLVNADATRTRIVKEGYSPDRISVIRNGIDTSRFQARGAGAEFRREFGLPHGAPLVAVLCRLALTNGVDFKGVRHFIEAAALIGKRVPEARFLIVGGGSDRGELERLSEQVGLKDRMIFTGFRLDVPEILSELTVSVHPSLTEAISNSLLESMAAGAPVVATRVGGTPEVVQEGITGILVPPGHPAELGDAISFLLENPGHARAMGEAGQRRVADTFSVERMVRDTEGLFENLYERATRRNPRLAVEARVQP